MLEQQVAQYKARAVAARDPALYPVLAALPDTPKLPAQGRNADHSGFNQKILDGLVAAAVIVIALDVLLPSTPASDGNQYPDRAILNGLQQARCAGHGLSADWSGSGCQ